MNQFARESLEEIIARHAGDLRPATPPATSGRFAWYAANSDALAPVRIDESRKARNLREVKRIAYRYPWGQMLIQRAMDRAGVSEDSELSEPDVDALLQEARKLDERAQYVCDDGEAPPAR